jgi:hypothetical protein
LDRRGHPVLWSEYWRLSLFGPNILLSTLFFGPNIGGHPSLVRISCSAPCSLVRILEVIPLWSEYPPQDPVLWSEYWGSSLFGPNILLSTLFFGPNIGGHPSLVRISSSGPCSVTWEYTKFVENLI